MARRYVLVVAVAVALIVAALAVVGASLRADADKSTTLAFTAQVRLTTSPDGLRTVVSVDVDRPGTRADGLMDRAFRVQHTLPRTIDYAGPALISFTKAGLLVELGDQAGWLFEVDPLGLLPVAQAGATRMQVIGISHHWGDAVRTSQDALTTTLLTPGCEAAALAGGGGDPLCDECEGGGPGTDGCELDCGGGNSCGANCMAGYYACCNCPSGCGCCPPKIERPQAANRPDGQPTARGTRAR